MDHGRVRQLRRRGGRATRGEECGSTTALRGVAASKAPASQGAAKDPKRNVRALYDFGEMLGKGGFAEVRLATEKATGKQMAMIAQERIKALMGNVAQGYERSKSIVENPDDMSKARAAADHYVEFSKAAQQE